MKEDNIIRLKNVEELNNIKGEKFKLRVTKFRKIFYFILRSITIISAIYVLIFLNESKILVLSIILFSYINLIMFFKWISYNFTTIMMWNLLDKSINKVEEDEDSIEEILNEYDDFKFVVGKHYGEIIGDLKKSLIKIKSAIISSRKNERMNIELVSNVTNKLEIPLNTIISNIETLKTNQVRNINEEKVLNELKKKSNNLKRLIDELFEASKAASGDINLEIEEIEISSLLRQALIEFKEEIDESNIIFKVNIPKDKIFVKCNGEKMWRVFNILIENTLKHSLDNSRVYIDLIFLDGGATISFKNTSKDELNIRPEELVKIINNKNDESSGLALEIAKNLVVLQKGRLNLDIEADLFKVNIYFDVENKKGGSDDDK